MKCETVEVDGVRAIVCSSGRRPRCKCGKPATLACDWKIPRKKSGTCDAPICAECTTKPSADKDICPDHRRAFLDWRDRREPKLL